MLTVASFRRDFKEFADAQAYPNSIVVLNIALATKFLNQDRWGPPSSGTDPADYTEWDFGAEYFIAHHLSINAFNRAEAENGAPPGTKTGAVTGKSVDKASINYDVNATADEDAGHWNLTVYGKQFIRLARMMGAGPVQVGANPVSDPLSSQNAYTGPWPANFPNPSG